MSSAAPLESSDSSSLKRSSSSVSSKNPPSSTAPTGRSALLSTLPPSEHYESSHRFNPTLSWTRSEESRLVLKTDLMLLSWICLMFFGLQLDRGNLSNALADNLLKDLKLTTDDYNNGTTVQLVAFLAAEFPVQFLVKRYGFKRIGPTLMVGWGTVSWAQAFMTNKTGFYITRALIGMFEGGFIPGVILYATYWYTSKELSVRLSFFWATLNVARTISALLAAGILEMRGIHGRPGWFWLFLLEGVLTVVIGLASFLYLPTSPTQTKGGVWRKSWYTPREEEIMTTRILKDDPAKGQTHLSQPATWKDVKDTWTDPALLGLFFIGIVAYIPPAPVSGYLTLTLKRLGFTTFNSNMLTIPAAVLQIVLMLVLSWSSDRFNERSLHCLVGEVWVLPLLISLISLPDGGREWGRFSLVTLVSGYPYFHPIVTSWISENTFDVKKRAVAAATYNVCVQIGSLISSQIYRKWDAPYYKKGNTVLLAICVLSILAFAAQRWWLIHLNNRKDKVWNEMSEEDRRAYQQDTEERRREGNRRLDFRFVH
ncbi:hypothetical protein ACQY0O_008177 [Thecaphora frezii]